MDVGTISIRYARALLGFASGNNSEDMVYKDMSRLLQVYLQTPEVKFVFDNPLITVEEKQRILTIAAGGKSISKTTEEFIHFVIKKGKEFYLFFIAMSYQNLYRKFKKIVSVEITSAQPISESLQKRIAAAVEKDYEGNTTLLDLKIDPEIIGGFIVEVENTKLDVSVRGELQAIKNALNLRKGKRQF